MSAVFGLFRLQQVDRQIDQTQARLNAIQAVLENDTELRKALDELEAAQKGCQEAQALLRESEAEVKAQQIKIEQAESSLYGGSVHNPKELQDLQNDVASLKRRLSTLEDRQLDAMLAMDTHQSGLEAAQNGLAGLSSRRGDEHDQLLEEQASLNKNHARLQAERQAVTTDLPAASLQMYEEMRGRKRGVAVSEVADNSCSACGTQLSPAIQQSARSSQIIFCPTCGRILYAS